MKSLKPLFISLVIIFLLSTLFLLIQGYIIRKVESAFIKNIEHVIHKEIDVGDIAFRPIAGIVLKDIRISEKGLPTQDSIFIEDISGKLHLRTLITSKVVIASFRIDGLKKGTMKMHGHIRMESKPFKNLLRPFADFVLDSVKIEDATLSSPYLNLQNISSTLSVKKDEVSSSNITFDYNNKPHTASFYIKEISSEPIINMDIAGENINAKIELVKLNDSIKIKKSEIKFINSLFGFQGEITEFENPLLLLYGSLTLQVQDASQINARLKNICDALDLKGKLYNEIYFRGRIGEPKGWEIGVKSRSPGIIVWKHYFPEFICNLKINNGTISVPLLSASPYDGDLTLSFAMDTTRKESPYAIKVQLTNINVHNLIQDYEMRNKDIHGKLSSEFSLLSSGPNSSDITGQGNIEISEADLGLMPILTPLVGNLYGFLSNLLPGLNRVQISGGTCNFAIKDRKIMTDNLWLGGDVLNIYAKGYIDFDKNLNFEVRNEFKESQKGGEDWRGGIVQLMAGVGKFIGKAYLTGTLSKPKWRFEYLSNVQNVMGNQLGQFLKGILE